MTYNFDIIQNRKGTNSVKHDLHEKCGKPAGLIPLWIADMDFKAPIEVGTALIQCAKHGIFGYSEAGDGYWEAVRNWFWDGFGYRPEREWLVMAPGVVFAVTMAIRAFTDEGDSVMIQRPVYHPFAEVINDNNRRVINNPLVYENGKYRVDFDDFEQKIVQNKVELFILCSPHNPVGRVWTVDELEKMGDICLKHGCIVVSDEIHCDFVYVPHRHHVFSMVKPEFADNSVICTAPSKTFNTPGLQVSNTFIQNPELRRRLIKECDASGYSQMNTMGLAACEAAYRHGREWLGQLLAYLSGNMDLVYEFGDRAGIRPVPLEGTYLAWLDFSPLKLSPGELDDFIIKKAGLWLSPGVTYGGEEGAVFQRINIASPRSVLARALRRLESAVTNGRMRG